MNSTILKISNSDFNDILKTYNSIFTKSYSCVRSIMDTIFDKIIYLSTKHNLHKPQFIECDFSENLYIQFQIFWDKQCVKYLGPKNRNGIQIFVENGKVLSLPNKYNKKFNYYYNNIFFEYYCNVPNIMDELYSILKKEYHSNVLRGAKFLTVQESPLIDNIYKINHSKNIIQFFGNYKKIAETY